LRLRSLFSKRLKIKRLISILENRGNRGLELLKEKDLFEKKNSNCKD
jgi:hypothetical protein